LRQSNTEGESKTYWLLKEVSRKDTVTQRRGFLSKQQNFWVMEMNKAYSYERAEEGHYS
jgi:hypothetical protein